MNCWVIPFSSEVVLSPQNRGLRPESCSFIATSNPSIVVNLPPSVPAPTSKSSSGMVSEQVSDFKTSRDMSMGSVTLRVILVPWSDIPDPDLTSLVRFPQLSQLVAMMITSLKNGMAKYLKKQKKNRQVMSFQDSMENMHFFKLQNLGIFYKKL